MPQRWGQAPRGTPRGTERNADATPQSGRAACGGAKRGRCDRGHAASAGAALLPRSRPNRAIGLRGSDSNAPARCGAYGITPGPNGGTGSGSQSVRAHARRQTPRDRSACSRLAGRQSLDATGGKGAGSIKPARRASHGGSHAGTRHLSPKRRPGSGRCGPGGHAHRRSRANRWPRDGRSRAGPPGGAGTTSDGRPLGRCRTSRQGPCGRAGLLQP